MVALCVRGAVMSDRWNSGNRKPRTKKTKRFNASLSASSLCSAFLPAEYRQKWGLIQQYQHFFEAQESDAVFTMVKVLNVTDAQLIVSVPNPALSTYLRMHGDEIKALLFENFGKALELKISSRPETGRDHLAKQPLKPAPHFDDNVCSKINDAANTIEDEDLQAALKSLSKTIRK